MWKSWQKARWSKYKGPKARSSQEMERKQCAWSRERERERIVGDNIGGLAGKYRLYRTSASTPY